MREITAVALEITTACNLHCPECCCRIHERPAEHYPWIYFESLVMGLRGIERVDLTGGEPTAHPQFAEFVPKFKELYGCNRLTLESNGFKLKEYAHLLHHFDQIRLSKYPGENEEICDWVLDRFPSYVQNGSTCIEIGVEPDERRHIKRSRRGAGGPCLLGKFEFALVTGGLAYPCRLGPAVQGAVGMVLGQDWRRKVVEIPMPCKDCWFSPGDPE